MASNRALSGYFRLVLRRRVILAALAACVAASIVFEWFITDHQIRRPEVFYAFFDLFAVTTGFLATFYSFVLSVNTEFIRAIKRSAAFAGFIDLVLATVFTSLAACAYSLILGIYNFNPTPILSAYYFVVMGWLAVITVTLYSFVRCFRSFLIIVDHGKG